MKVMQLEMNSIVEMETQTKENEKENLIEKKERKKVWGRNKDENCKLTTYFSDDDSVRFSSHFMCCCSGPFPMFFFGI